MKEMKTDKGRRKIEKPDKKEKKGHTTKEMKTDKEKGKQKDNRQNDGDIKIGNKMMHMENK